MAERIITIHSPWLHLPIGRNASRHYIQFEVDGKQFTEMHLGFAEKPDFYGPMDVSSLMGKELKITCDEMSEGCLAAILQGGSIEEEKELYADVYQEPRRQHYHFAPRRGWLNDPNGLVYDGEKFHMFFQHNPFCNMHGDGDIHWGHAVSTDAAHWQEKRDAIAPWTSQCHIASGSCIMDTEGKAGFGKGAMIAAFTHLGSRDFRTDGSYLPSQGQYMAYSIDGGEHFTFFPGNPRVPTENGKSWRDPRLFVSPDGGFGMAVYETIEKDNKEHNCVAFYHSEDLHSWTRTARTEDLFECPDLFQLDDGEGQNRWVLYGADGMYRLGDFYGGAFHPTGERFPLDFGSATYAGQTWTGRDDSQGRLHISWLQDEGFSWPNQAGSLYRDGNISQSMTVPCLLTLHKAGDSHRVHRNPWPGMENLHTGASRSGSADGVTELTPELFLHGDSRIRITARSTVTVTMGRHSFTYDPVSGVAVFSGREPYQMEKNGVLDLRVFTDTMSCECFLQEEISAAYGPDMRQTCLQISSEAPMDVAYTSMEMGKFWE